ncbi:hypothetical protein MKZ38_008207 [Zalerion maritima]|uniref:Uncharacterized protein n=1 Tax=Zalerion maritima TaxID=339359 RepID=A0AAD5WP97_9PEZI|nr:hypothetical protein MKZ38_008207 [Zalerion maritima]
MAQPTQQPQQQFSPGTPFIYHSQPTEIPFNRRWHVAKTVVRGWSFLFATIIIILDIVLILKANEIYAQYLEDGDSIYAYYRGDDYTIAFLLWVSSMPPAILVFAWDMAEFVTLCARRKTVGRGIHPGAHVGMDLIIWLVLTIIWGSLAAAISFLPEYYGSSDDQYISMASLRRLAVTLIVLLILLFVIHFFLFVRACVETDQRNKAKRHAREAIMVFPQPGAQHHPYYHLGQGQQPQASWFQPAPLSNARRSAAGPPPNGSQPAGAPQVQPPAQAYGNYYAPQGQPQNPQFSGYYAPQNSQPPVSGYYAPKKGNSADASSPGPQMSQRTPPPAQAGPSRTSPPAQAGPSRTPPPVPEVAEEGPSQPRPGTAH